MNQLWHGYPWMEAQLSEIQRLIVSANRSAEFYLKEPMDYTLNSGGKMLRPAFVLIGGLFGKTDENSNERMLMTAVAIETLHMATLVHDDIIDEAFLRRGRETVQSKYSKEFAVYMGDYLLSQCFLLLADNEVEPGTLKYLAKGVKKVCLGEMTQNLFRYRHDMKLLDYLGIIRGKTAALFAASLGVGAKLADAEDKTAKKLAKIGLNVGMAFQMIDDLLDYEGDPSQVGKDLQADLYKGYYTLPLILALGGVNGEKIEMMLDKQTLSPRDIEMVMRLVEDSGALEAVRRLAEKYSQKAMRLVAELEEGEGRQMLNTMIPRLLKRVF